MFGKKGKQKKSKSSRAQTPLNKATADIVSIASVYSQPLA